MNTRASLSRCPFPVRCAGLFALALSPVWAQTASTPDTEVIELSEFVVESIAEGQARAIEDQRKAANIKNVVTSDAVGRLPDFSVGEALSRVPGVSVQKDRGEPEFITIRGAAPRLNSVALNGDRIPSVSDPTEDRNDRSVTLNAVPTALISTIEVAKSVTPDMDADAVGGAVNLTTRSALDLDRRLLDMKAEWGMNDLNDGELYSFNLTFADRIGEKRNLGLLLGASYQFNERAIDEVNFDYGVRPVFGVTPTTNVETLDELDFRFRFLDRKRQGVNGQLDWAPGENRRFYVRGFYNEFRDKEQRIRLRNRFNSDGRYLSGTDYPIGVVDGNRFTRQDRDGFKHTEVLQVGAGGVIGTEDEGKFDFALSFAESNFTVDRVVANWENRLTDYGQREGVADTRFDLSDPDFPVLTYTSPSPTTLTQFRIGRRGEFIDQLDRSKESDRNASLNYTRDFAFGDRTIRIKSGYRARLKDTESRPGERSYTRPFPANAELQLPNFLNAGDPVTIFGRYTLGPTTNFSALRAAFADSPAQWQFNEGAFVTTNLLNTYEGSEDIHAGYVMGTTELGRLQLVGGVRYERTESEYTGYRFLEGDADQLDRVQGGGTYDDLFPSLLATYRLRDDLLFRAAWTNTLARPNYLDLVPYVDADVDLDSPALSEISLRVGNPDLKPFESTNWDVSFEWYYQRTGYVSFGAFYKDIANFEFARISDTIGTTAPAELGPIAGLAPSVRVVRTTPVNGADAWLRGVEVAVSHKFESLPAPFNRLGVIANAAWVEAEGTISRDGVITETIDRLPGQVDEIYNVQLYWENHRFALRSAWNFNGVYLESLDDSADGDIYVDEAETIDLSFEWKFLRAHRFFVEVKNVTDEYTERKYRGRSDRPTLREEAGRTFLTGVKLEF